MKNNLGAHLDSKKSLHILSISASIIALLLISLGSFVRVTGSGLACPDWPLCYGQLIPPLEYHILIEYSHRLTAALLSLFIAGMVICALLSKKIDSSTRKLTYITALFLLIQIILGYVTVVNELPPEIVAIHLGNAQIIFALLIITVIYSRSQESGPPSIASQNSYTSITKFSIISSISVLFLIMSGSLVVGSSSVVSCGSGLSAWPLCNGSLFPTDLNTGINLGHRFLVIILLPLLIILNRMTRSFTNGDQIFRTLTLIANTLYVCQIVIGALIPLTSFSTISRVLHITLATMTWGTLVYIAAISIKRDQDIIGHEVDDSTDNHSRNLFDVIKDYFWLTKPRVMTLLLFTAFAGAVFATRGIPDLFTTAVILIGGTFASGGAGAINQSIEDEIDVSMRRTRQRAVASGRISKMNAMLYGLSLNILAFLILLYGANFLAAFFAILGSAIYIFVYTMWLKKATIQNIVIGGAAGALPPVVGWTAVTNSLNVEALFLFAIVFFWTPPHFWPLSLLMKDDYEKANKISSIVAIVGSFNIPVIKYSVEWWNTLHQTSSLN